MDMWSIPSMSIEQFHFLATLIWGIICLLMGFNLLVFNIPKKKKVRTYNTSVKVLALNYLVLSILIFSLVFFDLRNSTNDTFPIPILLINLSQGVILTHALITLYAPKEYTWKNIIYFNIVPLSSLLFIYIICVLFFGDPVCNSISFFLSNLSHPAVLMRFILLLFYFYQVTFYALLIHKLAVRYTENLDKCYPDTIQLRPHWAKKNFYFAVTIGLLSIVACMVKNIFFDTIFTVMFCLFYYLFALRYMRYESIFMKLKPVFFEDLPLVNKTENINKEVKPDRFIWEKARNQIIQEKRFLQSGITVNAMAELFQTNRTSFSAALNKHERQNFNSFINRLRIEHAKQLILEKPELTIVEIAEQCGYSEQSNFTRQFKQYCNETPAVWAKHQNGLLE